MSAFANTGVPEDEGQHLQDVYPPASAHGGPGRFGFDPDAHLTESSPLATPENGARLLDEWSRHWDLSRPILLEKSPPNLIRGRFLQALFPEASFVFVVRHPVVVSFATTRWVDDPLDRLLEHWAHCHSLLLSDARLLRRVAIVRYEDLVARDEDAYAQLGAVAEIGTEHLLETDVFRHGRNEDYLARFEALEQSERSALDARYGAAADRFGYSIERPRELSPFEWRQDSPDGS